MAPGTRTKKGPTSPIYRTRRLVVGMFGLVLLGVAAMGTSLIIQLPFGALPRAGDGATAQMPYVRRLCPPSARTSIVEDQPRYATSPLTSHCSRYRPYWLSGPGHCRTRHRDEEWCGDFGTRVWHQVGAAVMYKYLGDLNSSAASLLWVADLAGTWHPVDRL
ncbi:MAG: hypothetical protein ABSE77_01350 [Acidimicrobiales bacterium]|jgi:hypothetical protein